MHSRLQLVLILLAAAVLVAAAARALRLPTMLGYLVTGIAIGPFALGWIPDSEEARYLAEFGVVFLMFSIGLEFSLPRLMTMRMTVFGFGGAQVVLTIVLTALIAWLLDLPLAGRHCAGRHHVDVVHRHRVEDDGRAAGNPDPAWPPDFWCAAVPGSGRGAAADPDSGLCQGIGRDGGHAGAGHAEGGGGAGLPAVCRASASCAPGFSGWPGTSRPNSSR